MSRWPFDVVFQALRGLPEEDRQVYDILQKRVDMFIDDSSAQITKFDAQANQVSYARTAHLITIATILLSAAALLLGQKDILAALTDNQKACIFLITMSLTVSLLAGVMDLRSAHKFFSDWANAFGSFSNSLSPEKFTKMDAPSEMYALRTKHLRDRGLLGGNASTTTHSSKRWENIQFSGVILAATLYSLLVSAILFDVPFIR